MPPLRSALVILSMTLAVAGCGGGDSADGMPDAGGQQSRARPLATPPGAVAQRYRVVNLDLPGSTNEQVFHLGINAAGQLFGTAVEPLGGGVIAFRYDPAAAVPLRRLDLGALSGDVQVQQVNARGQAVLNVRGDVNRAVFVDEAGRPTALPPPVPGNATHAFGLNVQGMVVGDSGDQGFAWTPAGGSVAAFPAGVPFSFLEDVNDAGLAVGRTSFQPGAGSNYLYSSARGAVRDAVFATAVADRVNNAGVFAGTSELHLARIEDRVVSVLPEFTPFGLQDFNERSDILALTSLPNGNSSFLVWFGDGRLAKPGPVDALDVSTNVFAINNHGLVVGDSRALPQEQRAFAWSAASGFVKLQSRLPPALQGLQLFSATAVNDAGQIVVQSSAGLLLLVPDDGTPQVAATLGALAGPELVQVHRTVSLSAPFMDVNTADTHTAVWSWGDGSSSAGVVRESAGAGSASGSHSYAAAGVYTVSVTLTDSTGRKASASKAVVAFDPAAGFVTGSGWIYSPQGAYRADPSLAGRASFQFVSKYKKGDSEPSGGTRFVFQAAKLTFVSADYDWLVVSGHRAQYHGSGRYNGLPGYTFTLTARDGSKKAGDGDRFRIRIWHRDAQRQRDVVDYDNQIDVALEGTRIEGTTLGGGSIVVHRKGD